MKVEQDLSIRHTFDVHGNPTHGNVEGAGILISFYSEECIETATGCSMIDVIQAVRSRLAWIQNSKKPLNSACKEFDDALMLCNKLIGKLRDREKRVKKERKNFVEEQA